MEQANHRKIIHIDMDCFFAAVEIRDNPDLRGLPIAVGAPDAPRGVLCTASYEARKFGVRAAMPNRIALAKCPQLRIIPLRMPAYKAESAAIMEIFSRFSDLIQPLSLDEAFIDVTDSTAFNGSATLIAREIRRLIYEERGLTASAGIAPNKFLAKIASDLNKPNGLYTLAPAQIADFMLNLPISKIWGVGPKSAEKLQSQGFFTCGDIQKIRQFEMEMLFGRSGQRLWKLAHGIDDSPVDPHRERKSFSKERTFGTDQPRSLAPDIAQNLFQQLQADFQHWQAKHPGYKTLGLEAKLRFGDFFTTTVHHRGPQNSAVLASMISEALERHPGDLRLIGVGFQLQPPPKIEQLEFEFDHEITLELWPSEP